MQVNLLLTAIVKQLGAFPLPLLRNYLYDPAARWQPPENTSKPVIGLPAVVAQLFRLCHRQQSATPQVQVDLDAYVQGLPGYFKPSTSSTKSKARKSTATKSTSKHGPASTSISYRRRPTLTQLRHSELGDSACEDVDLADAASVASGGTQSSVTSPPVSEAQDLMDETRSVSSAIDDGSSLALSDTLSSSSKTSTPLPPLDGGLTAEALSKHNELASSPEQDAVVEPSPVDSGSDKVASKTPSKKLALKLLIVQEFVKELAAFGMEHALFAIAI